MGRLFGTDGIRGQVNKYPMEPELILRIGLAAGSYFRKNARHGGKQKVVIGKDTRLSGYIFETALTAGFCASGLDVYQVGPLPTPAIAFITNNMRADFGVVISASHNPFQDNGIKFFDADGFKLPDSVEDAITDMALDPDWKWEFPAPAEVGRARRINDALGRYIVTLKNSFPDHLDLDGLRVVVDCANGAAYKVAPMALEELGADVIKIGTEPDGLNINYGCGSLHPEVVSEKVREYRADIGIALDGDADRVILSDENGNVLDGDQIMAICALDMLNKDCLPGRKLAATVMSNMALEVFMADHGGELVRTNVGDRYVVEAMRAQGISLGGEQSGHMIFMDHGTTGDGLLAGLQVLRIMRETGKPLSELAGLLNLYPQKLINVRVKEKKPFEDCPTVVKACEEAERKLRGRGRVLLRYSGTEALARIMVESENADLVEELTEMVAAAVRSDLQGE
ncbi:MAG: phosphoglucosamine mutase [Deltaproteobacteria bacterium]|nr:phosphoglucosamine mutase [Deltaproteobacteria bacterium]